MVQTYILTWLTHLLTYHNGSVVFPATTYSNLIYDDSTSLSSETNTSNHNENIIAIVILALYKDKGEGEATLFNVSNNDGDSALILPPLSLLMLLITGS